jgi:hypothetical protein
MTWHAQDSIIAAYVSGRIDDAAAASLETHLLACEACRGAVSGRVDPTAMDRVWAGVRETIDRPAPGLGERALVRVGIREDLARLLATTPALRASWLGAVAATLLFSVVASRALGGDPLPFLSLAPLVPVAGVAIAFGRPIDPAWELTLSTPTGGFSLMLIRSAAVLATSVVLAGAAALALPGAGWSMVAWLLPALCLTVLSLAASSTGVATTVAAGIVGTVWVTAVLLAARLADEPLAAFAPGAQAAFAALALLASIVVAVRHTSFERPARI